MNDDEAPRDPDGPTTEALPTTRPLPSDLHPQSPGHAQNDVTQVLPIDPAAEEVPRTPPPSVPPRERPAGDAPETASAVPQEPPSSGPRPAFVIGGAAIAAAILGGLVLGVLTLLTGSGETIAASSPTPSSSASASAAPSSTDAASPEPSEPVVSAPVETVGADGAPGDDGACTAQVRKVDAKDDEFDLEVRVKARAGGVETWEVRLEIGSAIATDVDDATLVGQSGGIVTVTNEDDADAIKSGKHEKFTLSGSGEPTGLEVSCSS